MTNSESPPDTQRSPIVPITLSGIAERIDALVAVHDDKMDKMLKLAEAAIANAATACDYFKQVNERLTKMEQAVSDLSGHFHAREDHYLELVKEVEALGTTIAELPCLKAKGNGLREPSCPPVV